MKTIFTTTIFTLILNIQSFNAQVGRVWATIENPSVLTSNTNNQINSNDSAFNSAIQNLNIISITKALPASRKPNLSNVFELSCTCDVNDLYATLVNQVPVLKGIEFAPNYENLNQPNDYNATFTSDYALDLIHAKEAWDLTTGNSNITIAISDQNYFVDHEELTGKITNYDATNTSNRTHGTAVAILAAGNTNNQIGKSAIGFNSSLALYRMNYNEMLIASYAGAKIINLSWTSGCSFSQYTQDAINEAYENGSFIIAAAGNGTTCGGPENLVYPAAYDNVFAVTSVGPNNNHERTIGNAATTHQHNEKVDLSAPGYDVAISTMNGFYSTGNGTSYAAPQVAGTVALMLAENPCLTNLEIEEILKNSAEKIDYLNPSYTGRIGAGRLDAAAAVGMSKTIIASIDQVTCFGLSDGAIDLTINSQNVNKISWTNGLENEDNYNLGAGTYKVQVEFSNGCKLWESFTITQPDSIAVEAQIIDAIDNDGSIMLQVEGGTPDYSYSWDNGSTQSHIENLSVGLYQVMVTDANGCNKNCSFEVLKPESTAGIDESNNSELTIYPNPSNGKATITWENATFELIQIYNQNGQLVNEQTIKLMNQFQVEQLNPGVYFINLISNNNQTVTKKLVVTSAI
jgi:hypothetical protein